MLAKSFQISARSRQLLAGLARASHASMSEVLEAALESYRRQQFANKANAGLARIRRDKQAWAQYRQELTEWETTLADGLHDSE